MSARNRPQVRAWVTVAGSPAPAAAAPAPAPSAEAAVPPSSRPSPLGAEPEPKNTPAHDRLNTPAAPVRGVAAGELASSTVSAWSGKNAVVSEFQVICGTI